MLVRLRSKSFKLDFSSTRTKNFPDAQAGFRKGRGTRDQTANIHWITEKARDFQKNIYFYLIDYVKAFDSGAHNQLLKILKEMGIPDHIICMQVKKQQLERDLEQLTCSKLGKEYDKAVYCYPIHLTSMQSTLGKMPG